MKSLWTFETLHICELCIYVSEFAYFKNFCRFSKLWNSAHLVNSAGVAARLPPREAAAAASILQCARPRSNKESVFCRKLSKIYPPCQNPDRSSYRLLNRLTRVARVFHQMKWADGSKTLIFRAEQNGAIQGNPQELLWILPAPGIVVAETTQRLVITDFSYQPFLFKKVRWLFLPIAHNGVRRGLVPVATALLLTAAAENQKINHKCFVLGWGKNCTTAL